MCQSTPARLPGQLAPPREYPVQHIIQSPLHAYTVHCPHIYWFLLHTCIKHVVGSVKRALTGTHTLWRPRQHGTANFALSIPHCRRTTSPVSSRANVEQDCLLWPPPREMATCWPVASPPESRPRYIHPLLYHATPPRPAAALYTLPFTAPLNYCCKGARAFHTTDTLPFTPPLHYCCKGREHSVPQIYNIHYLSLLHSTTVAKGESIPSQRYIIYITLHSSTPLLLQRARAFRPTDISI